MKIHPFANRFPMLPENELALLAEDIANHGLIHPIVLDGSGQLIDGRNRLAACKIVNLEPTFVTRDFENVEAFILSVNVHRRHITKGAQAMAMAIAYPEAKRGRPEKGENVNPLNITGSDRTMLSQARAVLRVFGNDHYYVSEVMNGGSLSDAYRLAKEEEEIREIKTQQLQQLKLSYPGIYLKVFNGDLSLAQGLAAVEILKEEEREKEERRQIHLEIQRLAEHAIVPLVADVDLSIQHKDVDKIVPPSHESPIEHARAQSHFVGHLIRIIGELQEIERTLPTYNTEETPGWSVAVRSALARGRDCLNRMGKKVNDLAPQLRSVK